MIDRGRRKIRASRHGKSVLVAAFVSAVALSLSACGSGDDEPASESAASTASASAAPAEPAPAVGIAAAETDSAAPTSSPRAAPAAEEPAAASAAPAPSAASAAPAPTSPPLETPPASTPGASAPVTEPATAAEPAAESAPAAAAESPATPTAEADAPASAAMLIDVPEFDAETLAMIEAGDPIAGRTYASRCAGCHALDPGGNAPGAAQIGPSLYGIFDAPIAAVAGFNYSPAFAALAGSGVTWTAARLNTFLTDPLHTVPGTRMTVGAVPSAADRANVIAFLRILADQPLPLTGSAAPAVPAMTGDADLLARIATADPDRGEALAARCSGCHTFEEGGATLYGPNLYEVVGALVGAKEGFRYSTAFTDLNAAGATWAYGRLDAFLANPAVAIPGTRMGFSGVGNADDRAAIIAYLRTLASEPMALEAAGPANVGVVRAGYDPITITTAQIQAGADLYDRHCTSCHEADLHGGINLTVGSFGVAPPLIGPNFETRWFPGTVYDLLNGIRSAMPPDDPGGLSDEEYADIVAYILAHNNFAPGPMPLPTDQATLANMAFFQQ